LSQNRREAPLFWEARLLTAEDLEAEAELIERRNEGRERFQKAAPANLPHRDSRE
jgi:hypothetical protein